MADKTGIEWTDATWNPIAGCSLVSPGCTNCYAMHMTNRFEGIIEAHKAKHGGDPGPMAHYEGTTKRVNRNPVWTGKIAKAPYHILLQPLQWKRPRRVFVNSMSDLFHESVPNEWIDEVFAMMALSPQHTFQILTKRPERMKEFLSYEHTPACITAKMFEIMGGLNFKGNGNEYMKKTFPELYDAYGYATIPVGWPLPNVMLGVSVEDHRRAEERIRLLLATPAAGRFLSMEPLLSAVDLNGLTAPAVKDPDKVNKITETCLYAAQHRPAILPANDTARIDWVIVGGESGSDARPMHPDWVRTIRDQCVTAGVPFFFKQWGQWSPPEEGEEYNTIHGRSGSPVAFLVDRAGNMHCSRDAAGEHAVVMIKRGYKKQGGNVLDGKVWQQMPGGVA